MTATAQRQQPARPSLGPVELALVAMLREAARTRAERRGNLAATYGLGRLLECAACHAPLRGDTGRYRHRDACPEFQDAADGMRRPSFGSSASVPAVEVDAVVERLLARLALRADRIAATIGAFRVEETVTDTAAIARVEQARSAALDRYRSDRDAAALERTMATLDRQEAAARVEVPTLSPEEARAYLEELPRLWADAPATRHMLAAALFDRVLLLGHQEATFDLSAAAIALGIADGMPASLTISGGYGRGERGRGATSHLTWSWRVNLRGLRRLAVVRSA